jgi:hypothetical protein
MKTNNIKPFLGYLGLYFLFIMLFAWIIYGCSAEYHMKKAIKKGYSLEMIRDTVTITHLDSFKVIAKDTVYWIKYEKLKDSIIYRTQIHYVPRWKVRFDHKRFNDSLKYIRTMYADSLRYALKSQRNDTKKDIRIKGQETKVIRSENKNGFADSVKWIAVVLVLLIIAYLLFKYSPKIPVK